MNRNLLTWPAAAAVTAMVTLAVAACSGSSPASVTPPAGSTAGQGTPAAYSGNPGPADCLLGANGADVEVAIGDPTTSCARWIQDLAGTGLAWYPVSQMVAPGSAGTADGETMEPACDLTDGTEELYVEDAGGQIYGDSICSQEEQNGWTPESPPGALAARAQQAARQRARASASAAAAQASASAAAARAQRVSQAQQNLQGDVSALESDSATLNNDKSLGGDITAMKQDYGAEQADYQTEQSDGCPLAGGDAGVVGGDADTVGGDLDVLGGDIQALQAGDITAVRTDIATVNSDLAGLRNLGASPGVNAAAAIAAGNQALKSAHAAIQWAQGQGKQINSQAQQLAATAQHWASQHGC